MAALVCRHSVQRGPSVWADRGVFQNRFLDDVVAAPTGQRHTMPGMKRLSWARGDGGPWHIYAQAPDPVSRKPATTACGETITARAWQEAVPEVVPVDDRCAACDDAWKAARQSGVR